MSVQKQMGLSKFISTEGFFGFGHSQPSQHDAKNDPHEAPLYDWMKAYMKNGKLNPEVEFEEGNISLHGNTAALFVRHGKEIDHPLNEFKKDLKEYQSIFNSNKSALTEFGKAQMGLEKDLSAIANSETTFEQVREAILKYQGAAKKFSNGGIAHSFREPNYAFLGDYPTPFVVNGHFSSKQEPKESDSVEAHPIDEKNQDEALKLAQEIMGFMFDLEDFDEDKIGMCWDMTDSPTRGFIMEIDRDSELMAVLSPFTEHGMVDEDHNGGLVDVLKKRVENLNDAMWDYIRRSCK